MHRHLIGISAYMCKRCLHKYSVILAVLFIFPLAGANQNALALNIELQPSRKIGQEDKREEIAEISIAQQYGVAYLPLMIMRQYSLVEKHTSAAGLGHVRVRWNRYPSGKVMNDALRAGLLDFASGGIVPMLTMWDNTRERTRIKGVAALSSMPMYLNSRNPNVKSLRDFTDNDQIALPRVKKSIQAVVLQMAAAQTFGDQNYGQLDKLTVSMAHPNARTALLSGKSEITAHLTSPPFQYQELQDPNIHRVFSSYDILGGPATFTAMWARGEFRTANPKTFRAVYEAVKEAIGILEQDKRYAAEVYIQQANSGLSLDFVHAVITQPDTRFGVTPLNVMKYAKFMRKTGTIKNTPSNWKEVFFPEVHADADN
jgi:NitT/TauT family transport system substrate-binding protein